jgi:integrase
VKASIFAVKNLKIKGRKLGQWLTIEEAQCLINKPPLTAIGQRDRAILALLIGAGLRRSEVASLQVKHFEQRDGGQGTMRWMLIGVQGKHGRTRNVPIADWVKGIADKWLDVGRIRSGNVFRRVLKSDPLKLDKDALTPQSVYLAVQRYGADIGRKQIAPHDLRRTFARLAFEGEAPLKQIQFALGHASQATTEQYVNADQDIQIAPGDVLGISVNVR